MANAVDTVHATGLPDSVDEELVRSIFETYGGIKSCKLNKGPKPTAIVQFATVEEASFCVENLSGQPLFEECGDIIITFHRPQAPKPAAPLKPTAPKAAAKPADAKPLGTIKPVTGILKPAAKPLAAAVRLGYAGGAAAVAVTKKIVRPVTAGTIRPASAKAAGTLIQGLKATPLKSASGIVRPQPKATAAVIQSPRGYGAAPAAGSLKPGLRATAGPYGGGAASAPAFGAKAGKGGADPAAGSGSIVNLKKELLDAGKIVGGRPREWDPQGELFVGGLPPDTTDLEIYEIFAPFGAIPLKGVKAMRKGDACTGVGYVNFLSAEDAQNAISYLDGHQMAGGKQPLKVKVKGGKQFGEGDRG